MIKSLANSSITNDKKYRSMMAGSVENNADHLIAETIVSSNMASVTFDVSSLAAIGYKHLQLRIVARTTTTSDLDNVTLQFNGDAGANYSTHIVYGDASSVNYAAFTGAGFMYLASAFASANSPASIFGVGIVDILDFASPSKNTTVRTLAGTSNASANTKRVGLLSGFWSNTAAVTSITLASSASFVAGSRFSLYASKG